MLRYPLAIPNNWTRLIWATESASIAWELKTVGANSKGPQFCLLDEDSPIIDTGRNHLPSKYKFVSSFTPDRDCLGCQHATSLRLIGPALAQRRVCFG